MQNCSRLLKSESNQNRNWELESYHNSRFESRSSWRARPKSLIQSFFKFLRFSTSDEQWSGSDSVCEFRYFREYQLEMFGTYLVWFRSEGQNLDGLNVKKCDLLFKLLNEKKLKNYTDSDTPMELKKRVMSNTESMF